MQIQAPPKYQHAFPRQARFGSTQASGSQPPQRRLISQHPSVHFASKTQNPTAYSSLYMSAKQTYNQLVQKTRKVASTIEYFQANLQLGFAAVGCMLTFLPIPDICRRFIERNSFFGPIKLSDLSLLQDKSLEPKIVETKFNMNLYKNSLKKAGLGFNPDEDQVRLHAWHIPAKPGKPTVLFNHGRGSNICYLSKVMRVMSDAGYGIFVYDYPGFGQSQGQPGEQASYKAGLAASKYLETTLHVPQKQQVIMGYSMGSAVAVDLASRLKKLEREPKALVLINTFPSIKETFVYRRDHDYRWTKSLFNENKIKLEFNSAQKMKDLNRDLPILILQGEKDTNTPIPLIKGTMTADSPTLQQHDITFEPLKGIKHRLKDEDYVKVGQHFFNYMDRHFNQAEQNQSA